MAKNYIERSAVVYGKRTPKYLRKPVWINGLLQFATTDEISAGTSKDTVMSPFYFKEAQVIAPGMDYKGSYNALTNTPVLDSTNYVLTGSINPTASTSVVGVGTLFLSELQVGDYILVSGETRIVATIVDDTNLTVTVAFTDTANDATPEKVGTAIAVSAGDTYTVTVAGTFFTIPVIAGDTLIAERNSATAEAHWSIIKTNATHTGDVSGDTVLTIGAKKVTLAMMEDGVDGELITYDANGVAAKVATGNAGQILTSNGAGAAPTFQDNAATPAKITGTVNTTDATVTTIDTIDTLTNNSSHLIDVFVTCEQDDNTTGGAWMKKLFVTKRAETVVIQTITDVFSADDTANLEAASVTAVVVGGNINIQVTGFAATNYKWNSAYEILLVTTN